MSSSIDQPLTPHTHESTAKKTNSKKRLCIIMSLIVIGFFVATGVTLAIVLSVTGSGSNSEGGAVDPAPIAMTHDPTTGETKEVTADPDSADDGSVIGAPMTSEEQSDSEESEDQIDSADSQSTVDTDSSVGEPAVETTEEESVENEKQDADIEEGVDDEEEEMTEEEKLGREAFQYTNEYRQSEEVNQTPLQWDDEVYEVALEHSRQMAAGEKGFNHNGFADRIRSLSFISWRSAENIYYTTSHRNTSYAAVQAWIRSAGHRKNLQGNYTHCAIAPMRSTQSPYPIYYTQLFVYKSD